MWYDVWDGDCHNLYATSRDGISWTKPSLGLVEHQGSKDNNLLFRRSRLDHMPQVIHTPWEQDPQHHYKLLNFDFGRSPPDHAVRGYWGAFSADGIHWTEVDRNPVLPDSGDVGHFIWDPRTERYLGYPKMFAAVRGFARRSVGVSSSTDFEQWTPAELVLVPDEWDDRWVTEYKQHTDFYGLTVFPYESLYLGFLWIFRITNGESDGPIFCELVSSRDGINWTRSEGDRAPILSLGESGSWDDGMVQTLNYPLLEEDTLKVFYGGFDQTHGFRIGRSGVGLATLRKDGFVSLEAGSATGTVTTRLLRNLEGELRLNANAVGGEIRVELLDENGAVLSGFGSADCDPVQRDGVNQRVSWGPEHDLIPGSEKPRRLRFVMKNASLYSFLAGPSVLRASLPMSAEASFTFESDQGRSASDQLVSDGVQQGLLHSGVSIVSDPENAVQGTSALAFQGAGGTLNTFEIEGTSHLGDRFTLATWVKSPNRKLTRLFSTYRGSGEPAAGELVFDSNPVGGVLRLILNGQRVLSRPQSWLGDRYHHFAATYSRGNVKLYLDGNQVGEGQVRPGNVHLVSDGSVVEYFAAAGTESSVGVHLAEDLRIGEDQGGRFIFHGHEVLGSNEEQLVGFVDNVLVAKRVLEESEIRDLVSKPDSVQEDRKVSDDAVGAGLGVEEDSRKHSERKHIAAIVTTFFPNSHAGVLVDKFLRGFPTDEGLIPPRTEIVSLYIDQIHERDVGRQIAHEFDIPLYESIRAALTLGDDKLAVDAVLLIGEHGDYPRSELGQEMLPRRYFFEQIAGVIGETGLPIPIYNDKHLSYRWDDAQWMYETARKMNIPLWAGSALPVVWRQPNWEHPQGQSLDQALVVGFHMVER